MPILISNLNRETSLEELKDFIIDFAYDLKDCNFINPDTFLNQDACGGFAYIEFLSESTESAAIEALKGKELKGRALSLDRVRPGKRPGGLDDIKRRPSDSRLSSRFKTRY